MPAILGSATLAGPFSLVQGGCRPWPYAFPVFLHDDKPGPILFWGLIVNVTFKFPDVLEPVQLEHLLRAGRRATSFPASTRTRWNETILALARRKPLMRQWSTVLPSPMRTGCCASVPMAAGADWGLRSLFWGVALFM